MKITVFLSFALIVWGCNSSAQQEKPLTEYPVTKSDSEWKKLLTTEEYYVLRQAGTEKPFSSELDKIYSPGTYVCKACGVNLYESEHKFDSRSGWPSFDRGIDKNLDYDVDYKIGSPRTEIKCSNCGSHLGHIFDDGPRETTGKRHCINGVALEFIPKN